MCLATTHSSDCDCLMYQVLHSLHSPQSEWGIPLAQWLESWASIRQSLGEAGSSPGQDKLLKGLTDPAARGQLQW